MDSLSKISLVWEYFCDDRSIKDICYFLKLSRATVYRWLKSIKENGLREFKWLYRNAKKRKRRRKIDSNIVNLVCRLRKKYKEACIDKIKYILERDYGINLGLTSQGLILHSSARRLMKFVVKWKKKKSCLICN